MSGDEQQLSTGEHPRDPRQGPERRDGRMR
jgi:hypothetical protein